MRSPSIFGLATRGADLMKLDETQEHSLPPADQEIACEQNVNCLGAWGFFSDLHKDVGEIAAGQFNVVSGSFLR